MQRLDSPANLIQRHAADRVLVDQLLRGDPDAWSAFVHKYGRIVRARVADVAVSFGQGGDTTAIDDGVAEVFAALLNNDAAALRAFAGRSSLTTYLAVIATRSATRGFARRTANTSCDSETGYDVEDPAAEDPIGALIRSENCERIQVLMQNLPEKQRSVLQLFHLEDCSYAQISEALQMPMGSIGPTLRRGEAKMKEWLDK